MSIEFECRYSTNIQLDSTDFEVQSVSIHGSTAGSGTLTSGFTIALSNADGSDSYILGTVQTVTVSWSVEMPSLDFYLTDCGVKHNTQRVNVIGGRCYSYLLHAKPVADDNAVAFSYRTFQVDGEDGNTLSVVCDVKICSGTGCDHPNTCPAHDYYQYSVDGTKP